MTDEGYQRILVPFDGSDAAEHGLQEAVALAGRLGAQLRLLTVLDTYEPRRRQMSAALEAACARAQAQGIRADTRVFDGLDGALSDVIARATAEWGADVVVMVTLARTGLPHLVMGSNADTTVRACPVPVLMVPPPASASGAPRVPPGLLAPRRPRPGGQRA